MKNIIGIILAAFFVAGCSSEFKERLKPELDQLENAVDALRLKFDAAKEAEKARILEEARQRLQDAQNRL